MIFAAAVVCNLVLDKEKFIIVNVLQSSFVALQNYNVVSCLLN